MILDVPSVLSCFLLLMILFFDKKSFYLRRNRYILRALDFCSGLSLLGSHAKD
jgi:hypothetical protein